VRRVLFILYISGSKTAYDLGKYDRCSLSEARKPHRAAQAVLENEKTQQ
jgi:hypothetical protein